MKGIIYLFKHLFTFLGTMRPYLPRSFAGLFIVSTFFYNLFAHGFEIAMRNMALSIFGAEQIINRNVTLALSGSGYGILQFFEILISFFILFWLIKFITKMLNKITGSQAEYGAYAYAILTVALIEYVAIIFLSGDFTFIPIKDGVIYLAMNLQPVLFGIDWTYWSITDGLIQIPTNFVESTVNVTLTNTTNISQ